MEINFFLNLHSFDVYGDIVRILFNYLIDIKCHYFMADLIITDNFLVFDKK